MDRVECVVIGAGVVGIAVARALALAGREVLDPIGAAALYGREVLGLSYRELAGMTGCTPRRLAEASRAVARRIFVQQDVSFADGS